MTWSRQQYEDRIRSRAGDLGILQHISETQIPLALERALATFSKDKPREHTQTFSGDGTIQTFDLTIDAEWIATWSRVLSVEHPTGKIPREFIDDHDYGVFDGTIEFDSAPDNGTNNIRIRHTAAWSFPDDDPSDDLYPIPEIYTQAIADLGASYVTKAIATEFARQASTSVAGDLFQRDPEPLFSAAASWKNAYEDTVLGRPTGDDKPKQPAMAVADVDVFPASLFHRRADYISEESLGD